jgi:hypothetical protein
MRWTGEQSYPGNGTSAKIALRDLSATLTISPAIFAARTFLSAWEGDNVRP